MPYVAFCTLLYLYQAATHRKQDWSGTRANENWSREEVELLWALHAHGLDETSIATLLRRSAHAIAFEIGRDRLPTCLETYPQTAVRLCPQDIELLRGASGPPATPLWDFGLSLSAALFQSEKRPTLKVIKVKPHTFSRGWLPPRDILTYWTSYKHEVEAAVQAVWADLAVVLTKQSQVVVTSAPDSSYMRRTAIRAMLERATGAAPPRNTVVLETGKARRAEIALIDKPTSWVPQHIARRPEQTVIVVLPYVGSKKEELERGSSRVESFDPTLPQLVKFGNSKRPRRSWHEMQIAEWNYQRQWLMDAQGGRFLQVHEVMGLTTSTERSRLPVAWERLGHLPTFGTLYLPDELSLAQAVVWHTLLTKARSLRETYRVSAKTWHEQTAPELAEHNERLQQRLYLDLSENSSLSNSQLVFKLSEN